MVVVPASVWRFGCRGQWAAAVKRGLNHLQRDVFNLELSLELLGDGLQKCIPRRALRHHQVGCQRHLRCAHGPNVQVMHMVHAGLM